MNRADVGFVLGLAGFLMGGAAVYVAVTGGNEHVTQEQLAEHLKIVDDNFAGLGGRVQDVHESVNAATRRLNGAQDEIARMRTWVDSLSQRLDKLERRAGGGEGVGAAGAGGGDAAGAEAARAREQQEFEDLRAKVFAGRATRDEQARFWDLAQKRPELIGDLMAKLEAAVAERPRDIDARLSLARAYITKLYSAGSGPQSGVWAGKAEEQWKAVLEQEPNHWDARYHLGFSYSQYPDFLNRTPDAIREFETLRRIQESSTPESFHAQTYFQLSNLYRKAGNEAKAREALEEGLRRFPDDANLRKAHDAAAAPVIEGSR